MKKALIFSLLVWCSASLFAQVSNDSIVYKGEKDYAADEETQDLSLNYKILEPQLLADINWLDNTPLSQDLEVRNDKNRFVLMWMTGAPYIDIKIDNRVVNFVGGEPWLLMHYMMGWTEYFLKNNYSQNEIQLYIAGVKNVVDFYNKNKHSLLKNKEVEEYVKLEKKGKLEEYITSVLMSGN